MITSILTFCSHLLCIYTAYHLLITVVDWKKFTKVYPENQGRLNMLVLLLSIVIGYFVSHFFLEILSLGRQVAWTV